VDYEVPGGRLIDAIFVRPDMLRIFTFRQDKLRKLFSPSGNSLLESVGETDRES
jgi:hypothetical protein